MSLQDTIFQKAVIFMLATMNTWNQIETETLYSFEIVENPSYIEFLRHI